MQPEWDGLDNVELDQNDTDHLDTIKVELLQEAQQQLNSTDLFFSALHNWHGNAVNPPETRSHISNTTCSVTHPGTRSGTSAPVQTSSHVYVKLNPYEWWSFYVVFSDEQAGMVSSVFLKLMTHLPILQGVSSSCYVLW